MFRSQEWDPIDTQHASQDFEVATDGYLTESPRPLS